MINCFKPIIKYIVTLCNNNKMYILNIIDILCNTFNNKNAFRYFFYVIFNITTRRENIKTRFEDQILRM